MKSYQQWQRRQRIIGALWISFAIAVGLVTYFVVCALTLPRWSLIP